MKDDLFELWYEFEAPSLDRFLGKLKQTKQTGAAPKRGAAETAERLAEESLPSIGQRGWSLESFLS